MADLLDLDAEVLRSQLDELTAWIHDVAADRPPQRIVDLGCGTGAGAIALAGRFAQAAVSAVDQSAYMLDRLGAKARALGLSDRIRTVRANLDEAWPAVGDVDLAWASASLHHLADPDRTLAEIRTALRPGGLLAAIELDSFPRFLPEDIGIGRPGLEERCHAVLSEATAGELPHLGADWGALLTGAGFTIEAKRIVTIDLAPPLPAAVGRYAQASLRRARSRLDGRIAAEDLAALDRIVDGEGPDSVLRRTDLTVRATRSVWIARRP